MAIFHPEQPAGDEPSSELKVRRALRALDDEWHVFHRVRWQSVRAGRQGDGEADFILVHRLHGIVVVEVKGGRVQANDGHWTTTDRFDVKSTIKNPYEQVVASKHALLAFLRHLLQAGRVPPICHLVIFPDGVVDGSVGLHPPEVTWEQPHLDDLAASVSVLLRHWSQWSCPDLVDT